MRQRRWYRRWQARFTLQHQEPVVASDEPSAAAMLEAREDVERLQRALARLSDKYRAAVVLCYLEELSVREVARIVGANELTVRSRLRDGRKQLQRLLLEKPNVLNAGGRHELSGS